MPTLEQIASEVVLLSPEDHAERLALEKMIRAVAMDPATPEPIKDLAWEAVVVMQGLLQSKDVKASLKRLSDVVDKMVRAEAALAPTQSDTNSTEEERVASQAVATNEPIEMEESVAEEASSPPAEEVTKPGPEPTAIVDEPVVEEVVAETPTEEASSVVEDQAVVETPLAVETPLVAEAPAPTSPPSSGPRIFDLPAEIDHDLVQEFRSESVEHFQQAEVALMALENDPNDAESVNTVFRAFHTVKGVAGFVGISYVTELAHKAETYLDRFRKKQLVMRGNYMDLAFEALDLLKNLLATLNDAIAARKLVAPANYDSLIYRLEHPELIESADAAEPVAAATPIAAAEQIAAEAGARPAEPTARTARETDAEGMVKVNTSRLDNLINMVGELVIAQSMVSQDPAVLSGNHQRLIRNVTQLNKITRSLQELSLSMRMVPMKSTFQKMARLVRDLARKAHKEIVFETIGEDTELDRNMVEAIADPLVHMVRNAADHGVEQPEDRESAGKPRQGHIVLSAAHEGGNVVITLKDDGRGLSKQKIFNKAMERGLIDGTAQLTDADVHNLIFMPGFSTAEKVTDVSGRGVGMDVVRTNVEALRGTVEITSVEGQGSIFSIRLPLTLAIIDGMVVRAGSQRFILPTIAITETFRAQRDDLTTVQGRNELVMLRGNLIPVCRLERLFNINDALTEIVDGILVVTESKGRRTALLVDELLGQQQVVIKSLGAMFGRTQGVSGGAILGDGRVCLILDVEGLMKLSMN